MDKMDKIAAEIVATALNTIGIDIKLDSNNEIAANWFTNQEDAVNDIIELLDEKFGEALDDSKFLDALRAAGVDNWEGYDFAIDIANDEV